MAPTSHCLRLEEELAYARRLQALLLPVNLQKQAGISVGACSIAAHQLGGDFYDLLQLSPRNIFLSVGDVMGKGPQVAYLVTVLRSALRTGLTNNPEINVLLNRINTLLFPELNRNKLFLTLLCAYYHSDNKELIFANGGHYFPLVYRALEDKVEEFPLKGLLLGGKENTSYQSSKIKLSKGDVIFFYTDGLTEALNPEGKFFGRERILEFLKSHSFLNAPEMTEALIRYLFAFIQETSQKDDITMLTLKIED